MTKKTRTILFLICLLLFILIAPSTVFYSQGYRIDFENKKITQTGGLFLKVLPKSAEIYLDGKLKKKTDFFFGSALIENLLPKKYGVEIKKEGYHPWQKNLEIKEKQVTEAKNIVLIPKDPKFTILGKEIDNFYFSPDEKKIILKTTTLPPPCKEKTCSTTTYSPPEGWALKLFDLERKVKSHLVDEHSFIATLGYARVLEEKDISKTGVELFDLKFSPDAEAISLEVGMEEQIKYFTLEIDKTPPVLTESEKPLPSSEDAVTSKTIGQDLYYLDNSGHLFKNEEKLTEKPFPVKPDYNLPTASSRSLRERAPTEYTLEIFQNFIFLRESQTWCQFDSNSKSFEKIFEPAKGISISPDLKKLAYFNDYEIWILFLDDDLPAHRKGDRVFLTRFSEKIGEVFWFTYAYLIFNVGNKIKIAEIDDRDRINIVDLAEFENPKIYWNKIYKKLYVLSEGNLYNSESLSR